MSISDPTERSDRSPGQVLVEKVTPEGTVKTDFNIRGVWGERPEEPTKESEESGIIIDYIPYKINRKL